MKNLFNRFDHWLGRCYAEGGDEGLHSFGCWLGWVTIAGSIALFVASGGQP